MKSVSNRMSSPSIIVSLSRCQRARGGPKFSRAGGHAKQRRESIVANGRQNAAAVLSAWQGACRQEACDAALGFERSAAQWLCERRVLCKAHSGRRRYIAVISILQLPRVAAPQHNTNIITYARAKTQHTHNTTICNTNICALTTQTKARWRAHMRAQIHNVCVCVYVCAINSPRSAPPKD